MCGYRHNVIIFSLSLILMRIGVIFTAQASEQSTIAIPYRINPIGLVNHGSTCYLNSVFQFLNAVWCAYDGKVTYNALEKTHTNSELSRKCIARWSWYIDCFCKPYATAIESSYSPSPYITVLKEQGEFPQGQSDAARSFENIIVGLAESYPGNSSMISYTEHYECDMCHTQSHKKSLKTKPFLTLDINDEVKHNSLIDSFKKFIAPDSRDKRCDSCSQVSNISHQAYHTLSGLLPDVLLMKLLAFDCNYQQSERIKRMNRIPRTMDLQPYCDSSIKSDNYFYRCIGMVVHCGFSTNSGHYIAYVRRSSDGKWILCNDDSIIEEDDNNFWDDTSHRIFDECQTPYLLAYERIKDTAEREFLPDVNAVEAIDSTQKIPVGQYNKKLALCMFVGALSAVQSAKIMMRGGRWDKASMPLIISAGSLCCAALMRRHRSI